MGNQVVTLASAVYGGIVMTFISIEVEVTNNSTVGNILIDIVHCIRLGTSGERDHTLIFRRLGVPDDTLDKTLASADRVEVDLSGRGVESHGCLSITL